MDSMNHRIFTAFLFLLVFYSSSPGQVKVPSSLLEQASEQPIRFLIWLNSQVDLSAAEDLTSKEEKSWWVYTRLQDAYQADQDAITSFLQSKNAPYKTYTLVNAIATYGNGALMQELASLPQVKAIVPDPQTPLDYIQEDISIGQGRETVEWGISQIRADQVWDLGFRGQGITLGGQDTGYDWIHPALIKKYRGYHRGEPDHNYNWHDAIRALSPLNGDQDDSPDNNPCGFDADEPCDDGIHGTHTMGTMVGDDELGNRIGVAPDANWIGCRNMDRGWGWPSTYLECFDWLLAPTDLDSRNPDPSRAPHVINNSWACPEIEGCNEDNWSMLEEAVEALRAAGIVVVVSAGNRGPACETTTYPPARFEGSFSIGANAESGQIANFSSRGAIRTETGFLLKPNVSAPGVRVRSSVTGGNYRSLSGTSMAGPHVAGTIALILSANPALAGQVEQIETIVEETATPVFSEQACGPFDGNDHPNAVYGFGRIDALRAVEAALALLDGNGNSSIEINLFPNPASDWLFLSVRGISGQTNLRLLDLQGRIILEQRVETNGVLVQKMDVSQLPSGLYVISVEHPSGSLHRKVLRP